MLVPDGRDDLRARQLSLFLFLQYVPETADLHKHNTQKS